MTLEVFKAQQDAQNGKMAALESKNAELEAKLAEKETAINNLDESVKSQQATIDALKVEVKASARPASFKQEFRSAFEAKKADIMALVQKKADRFDLTLEVKTDIGTSAISPNNRLGVADDPTIYAAPYAPFAFIATLGLRPRTGNKLGWVEATTTPVVDYVAELATNSNQSSVAFAEKTRAYGKVATYMTISTEMEDWFEQLYDWCVNEGAKIINAKIDNDILLGVGSDADAPAKIYGLKYNATAFSALAAGAIIDANEADVIIDAAGQIAKENFNANVAFVNAATLAAIRGAKDANGNYLYDQVRGAIGNVRIVYSDRVPAGEMLVMDTTCAQVYAGNSYELEFERVASIDGYKVYFRKAAQVKVPTANKKGIIHVSSITTAKAALHKVGAGAALAELAATTHVFNTDEQA